MFVDAEEEPTPALDVNTLFDDGAEEDTDHASEEALFVDAEEELIVDAEESIVDARGPSQTHTTDVIGTVAGTGIAVAGSTTTPVYNYSSASVSKPKAPLTPSATNPAAAASSPRTESPIILMEAFVLDELEDNTSPPSPTPTPTPSPESKTTPTGEPTVVTRRIPETEPLPDEHAGVVSTDAAVIAVMEAAAKAEAAAERKVETEAAATAATAKATAAKAVVAEATAKRAAAAAAAEGASVQPTHTQPIAAATSSFNDAHAAGAGASVNGASARASDASHTADDSVIAAALDAGHDIPLELLEVLRLKKIGSLDPVGQVFGKGHKPNMSEELIIEPAPVLDFDGGNAATEDDPPTAVLPLATPSKLRQDSDGWEVVVESPMVTPRPHGVSDPYDDW
jgi:hypothetical protein